jgi:hypothetical protein
VIGERRVPLQLQNLHHRLLDKSIQHSWDALVGEYFRINSTSSWDVAQPGRAAALGAPPSLPTALFFQFRFDCSQQFGESASRSKLTPTPPIRCVLVQFWYSGTHEWGAILGYDCEIAMS